MTDLDQEGLLRRIALRVSKAVPVGWSRVQWEYCAAGRHAGADVTVFGPDGLPSSLRAPAEVVNLLAALGPG